MNNETQTVKRRPGRPALDSSQPSEMIFARVTPAMVQAVRCEAERRGIVASAFVRRAIELALSERLVA
jgi:hypothetical protein